MDEVRARVASAQAHPRSLVWDSTSEIEARTFDLLTAHMTSDEERALAPLQDAMYASSCARACVHFFEKSRGLKRPVVAKHGIDARQDWAQYAAFLKAHFPALLDDAIARLFKLLEDYTQSQHAAYDAVADDKTVEGTKTTWRIGSHTITHSGQPERGRWSIKQAKPKKPKQATVRPTAPSAVAAAERV